MDEESLDGVTLRQPVPTLLRVGMAVVGIFCIGLATWELGRGLWPPSFLTLFFGIILCGAWLVGGGFLSLGVFGDAQVWNFSPGRLDVEFSNPFRRRNERVLEAQVLGAQIRTSEGESGPDSYSVLLLLRDGRKLETSDYTSRAGAELMRRRIARHFGVSG